MESFGSIVWFGWLYLSLHTAQAKTQAKFSRYIILQANVECTFAACARLSSLFKSWKERPISNPIDRKSEIRMHVKDASRELWCIHLCVTLTAPTLHLRSFSYFLLPLAPIAVAASVTTSSFESYSFSGEKLVIDVYLCWCCDSANGYYQFEMIRATLCIGRGGRLWPVFAEKRVKKYENPSAGSHRLRSYFSMDCLSLFACGPYRRVPTPNTNCNNCNRFNLFLTSNQKSVIEWDWRTTLCADWATKVQWPLCADLRDNQLPFTSDMHSRTLASRCIATDEVWVAVCD